MPKEQLIPADEFCASHHIEISFIRSLQQSGVIEMTVTEDAQFIHADKLQQLEKIVRMFYEMDINLEGIETITHLLNRINSMQHEITALKNKLRFYEMND